MTARQIRRAQEYKDRKLARKAAASAGNSAAAQNPETSSPISQARLDANRANAQSSTGPRTEEGKAISSRNNFRHGFNGTFCVQPTENAAEFMRLIDDLITEHHPATPTERLLVIDMARHYWLIQRAIRLQEACLQIELDEATLTRQLSLWMRYQTTNQRAFHRCLGDLMKLRKQRPADTRGFESQKAKSTPEKLEHDQPDEAEIVPEHTTVLVNGVGATLPTGFESQNGLELSADHQNTGIC